MKSSVIPRQTKYCTDIEKILQSLGHATNSDLLQEMQKKYPDLSATTIHRATARLQQRKQIGLANLGFGGVLMYDANTLPHDHFVCQSCNNIRDIDIAQKILPEVNMALGDCRVNGRVVMMGVCNTCNKRGMV